MRLDVLTLFPEFVAQVGTAGIPRKARDCGALDLVTRDLRDYSERGDRRVDDRPYGGGPGMVVAPEPLARAIAAARVEAPGARVVALSPQGERFSQAWAERLAAEPALILVCGRYEGLDERIAATIDLELSIGDFVLSGGELAAMVVVDALARLLPGVLGHEGSAAADSFSAEGLLDHPHYTRPPVWRGQAVPEVLLSGDHAKIARWRLKRALGATFLKRPDLVTSLAPDGPHAVLLREFLAEVSGEKNDDV